MTQESTEIAREIIQGKVTPPPTVNKTIPIMQSAKERANDLFNNVFQIPGKYTAHALDRDSLIGEFESDYGVLKQYAVNYWEAVDKIDRDPRLSDAAKAEDKVKARDAALLLIERLDADKDFDAKIKRLDAELINRYTVARKNNRPENETLAYLQQSEMRAYIAQLRTDARAKDPNVPDPIHGLLDKAISDYGPSHEVFIGAVLDPPFPVSVIEAPMKEQAIDRLKAQISPIQAEHRGYLQSYQRVLAELVIGAKESVLGRGATKQGGIVPTRH